MDFFESVCYNSEKRGGIAIKNQSVNPYLPSFEYVADGEPHVFDDRLYIFGSHDSFGGKAFCEKDYVCWSAPTDDLSDWRYEGIVYKKIHDPANKNGKMRMFAPDVCKGKKAIYFKYSGQGSIDLFALELK